MAKQKRLKCSKCDRRFSMPAHLARHVNSAHGSPKKKAGRPRNGRRGRRPATVPNLIVHGFDHAKLSLTQLCHVIDIACAEAKRRLEQF
jgi:uncharacterized C2H2 Zn-finger protein